MSYCVNCGVKLDPSLKYCPLCNTPVINPHDLSKMQPVSPFPKEKGQVEVVRRKDLAILLSVSLTAAGLCSLLLKSAGIQAASLVALRNRSLCPDLGNVNPCSNIYQASYLPFPALRWPCRNVISVSDRL